MHCTEIPLGEAPNGPTVLFRKNSSKYFRIIRIGIYYNGGSEKMSVIIAERAISLWASERRQNIACKQLTCREGSRIGQCGGTVSHLKADFTVVGRFLRSGMRFGRQGYNIILKINQQSIMPIDTSFD